MDLTQQAVLSLLLSEGGRVEKQELVRRFRDEVDSVDPAEKERNRERFKTFVNNLAVVREEDGVRYVVLRKAYRHLLDNAQTEAESTGTPPTGERQPPPVRTERTGSREDARGEESGSDQDECDSGNPADSVSPVRQALQRSEHTYRSGKRMLRFTVTPNMENRSRGDQQTSSQSKPYSLPLRLPPSTTTVQIHKLKEDPAPEETSEGPEERKVSLSVREMADSINSTQLKRSVKSTKDARIPSSVPLEQSEHEWLVKCAAGHWGQVYGLLLRDSQLAEKKDFMSGFTALHWAAKYGNSDMLVKIVDVSKKGGVDIDINAKTHGGYTPLHIAAMHDKQYVIAMLVNELGANIGIRDNCGKKAYHYLHKDTRESVREILGEPKAQHTQDHRALPEREELELFPDLSKSLQSIGRLFQPHTPGHKKKHKLRPGIHSLSEDLGEDEHDGYYRHRLGSDASMWSLKEQ
ncbi:ankyrin repeat domain-containing protein SOWAHA [Salarias fasciatus]|uniref:ankyrin repeat domain-containing protein SOWAHA n=1 Tax=Salarias fasciatus TaxID=181472 RepID=UPI0011768CC8|nr:ankyrin repeat domain-containing protein SOWAHA-like [Salarias fasciatus]